MIIAQLMTAMVAKMMAVMASALVEMCGIVLLS